MPQTAALLARSFRPALLLAAAALAPLAGAQAGTLGAHPAMLAPRQAPGIDPSTFIVGHPAGGRAGVPATNAARGPHPALLTAQASVRPVLDVNAFRVQPPATTRWTVAPMAPTVAAAEPAAR